ncbi:hypothetical protein SUGI_0085530 [Cryptomeria japonica]|nr:hypothetical protein SUGI_0085530 [Cryptomeria japonica]
MTARSSTSCNEYSPDSGERIIKTVVVAMSALNKMDFSTLKWALHHVVQPGDTIALVGAHPWQSIMDKDISVWADLWAFNEKDLKKIRLDEDWVHGKYPDTIQFMNLCREYGAKPQVLLAIGCKKLTLLDKIINLRAAWVVFDRSLKKRADYYKKRIPCNIALVMDGNEVNILRTRCLFSNSFSMDPPQCPTPGSFIPEIIIPSPLAHWFNDIARVNLHDIPEEIEEKGKEKNDKEH